MKCNSGPDYLQIFLFSPFINEKRKSNWKNVHACGVVECGMMMYMQLVHMQIYLWTMQVMQTKELVYGRYGEVQILVVFLL